MAVHNEHSLRSFASFCDADNFEEDDEDDDDGENKFIISLDDSDEDGQKSSNMTSVYPIAHKPHTIFQSQETSMHVSGPCNVGIKYINTFPNSVFTSCSTSQNASTYQQNIVSAVNRNQPSVHCTSKVTPHGSFQQSTHNMIPDLSCEPVSELSSQDGMAIPSNNGSYGTVLSVNFAADVIYPNKLLSESVSSQFVHSENVSSQLLHSESQRYENAESTYTRVSQLKLPKSPSALPKMHLETIHFDKEAGGIWSEAVFLTSDRMSDRNFSDVDPMENISLEVSDSSSTVYESPKFITSNIPQSLSHDSPSASCYSSSCLTTPDTKSIGFPSHSQSSVATQSTKFAVRNESEKLHLEGTAACTCIMCYKDNERAVQLESKIEDTTLTEEEKLFIFKEPVKRKRQKSSTKVSKNKKTILLRSCNVDLKCPTVSTLPVGIPVRIQSSIRDVSSPYNYNTVGLTAQYRSIVDGHSSNLSTPPKSLSANEPTQGNSLVDRLNRNKPLIKPATSTYEINTNTDVVVEPSKTLINYEIPVVTSSSNVSSVVLTTSKMPRLISAPMYRSNPTKVFLKPSEVPGQRLQSLLPTPELKPMNNISTLSNDREHLVQPTVACKESQQTSPPSVTLSSPPSYKIIYVRPDQVLVCPNNTSTSSNVIPMSKQPQNNHQVTVIKLPQVSNQNKLLLSPDSRLRTSQPSIITENSPLSSSSGSNIHPSLLNPVENKLRHVLRNAETVDISTPGKVLIKLKSSDHMQGSVLTSDITTTPTTKSPQKTVSLLKDFKLRQVKTTESSAPSNISQAYSITSNPSHSTTTSTVAPKPSKLEVTQTLMCLIKSHFQEQTLTESENMLVNLVKEGGVKTSDPKNHSPGTVSTSQHNIKDTITNISNKINHAATYRFIEEKQTFTSPDRDKSEQTNIRLDTVSSPCLPQEGLPSTYVEDWVNNAKTYVSEHLNNSNCLHESQNLSPSVSHETSSYHHKAFIPSLAENSKDHLKCHINNEMKSSTSETHKNNNIHPSQVIITKSFETHNQRETLALPKIRKLLSKEPECTQILPNSASDSSTAHISSDSSNPHISNIYQNNSVRLLNQPPTSQLAREQTTKPVIASSKRTLHFEALAKNFSEAVPDSISTASKSSFFSNHCEKIPYQAPKTTQSSSTVINSSTGIKLKIKLSELRKDKVKDRQSLNTLESSFGSCESASETSSKDEVSLQKRLNLNDQEEILEENMNVTNKSVESGKTETAEEMFQRFQKQAEEEVLKAQMGMGYLSRSLRPARSTMALMDKYQYGFAMGHAKKKTASEEKHMHSESERTVNNNLIELDQQTGKYNSENKKSHIRNKRQAEETGNKEKVKQPKMCIKDYPRLKEDCSITDGKRLFCSNILAGHKVYVKFNTYENVVSSRAFLVPFFNIGGSRTQFDVEDMEYINKSVLEFEKDERSCARHLLFYVREGRKAAFLRKETYFQSSHIDGKNYKKSSFILEGFSRDMRKQPESSPEQWKVDNTVDIEIDRAEVDNDAEMEFDANMNYEEVANELEVPDDRVKDRVSQVLNPEHEIIQANHFQNTSEDELSQSLPNRGPLAHVETIILNRPVNHHLYQQQSNGLKTCTGAGIMNLKDFEVNKQKPDEDYNYGNNKTILSTSDMCDSAPCLNNPSAFTEKQPEFLPPFPYKSTDGSGMAQVHLETPSTCTVLRQDNTDESESKVLWPLQFKSFYDELKQEEPDDGYESCIKHPNSTHNAGNICSTYFSSNSTSNQDEHFDKCNNLIKEEPIDEYFESSAEVQICLAPSCTIEQFETASTSSDISQHATHLSGSHITCLSTDHPTSVNITSEKVYPSNSIIDIPDQLSDSFTFSPSTGHVGVLQGQTVEPFLEAAHTMVFRPQVTDATAVKSEIHNSESCQLELSLKNIDTKSVTSHCPIDSASDRTTSITEPSLPESPLPSSSVSVSSEISASSDNDEKHVSPESEYLTAADTGLQISELTTEDGNKQNSIHNKITSLVESLRHRLTQDTSCLPPWLASTNTEVKKKKRLKIHVKKENIFPADTDISVMSSSEVESPTSQTIPAQVISPSMTSAPTSTSASSLHHVRPFSSSIPPSRHTSPSFSPTDSISVSTKCPHSPLNILQSVVNPEIAHTGNLPTSDPLKIIPNKNPMLLPVIQPMEKHVPLIKCAAVSQVGHKYNFSSSIGCDSDLTSKMVTETELLPVIEDVFIDHTTKHEIVPYQTTDSCTFIPNVQSQIVNQYNNSGDHCAAALLETVDVYRRSPVDFEIEVGEEDLPETALSLQPILPENVTMLLQDMEEEEPYQINHLHPSNFTSGTNGNSPFSRLSSIRTKQKEHFKDDLPEVSTETGKYRKGSVANYLCQKFSFSGTDNKIKGPRLLHMPASNKSAFREQSTEQPNTSKVNTPSRPISAELTKTPSVIEIFGTSIGKETAINANINIKSPEMCSSHPPLSNNSSISTEQQNMISTALCQSQVTKNRVVQKKSKVKPNSVSGGSGFKSSSAKPKLAASRMRKITSAQYQPSQEFNKNGLSSEFALNMYSCKVVLTKLEKLNMSDVDKLSENVFILKNKTTEIIDRPEANITEKHSDSSSKADCIKSNLRKVAKKKRKKTSKMTKKLVVKPKRDIVDYYTYMLENLQKKAQQLEEETRRKAEENAKSVMSASNDCQGVKEGKIAASNSEEAMDKNMHEPSSIKAAGNVSLQFVVSNKDVTTCTASEAPNSTLMITGDRTIESSCLESLSQRENSGDKTVQASCLESVSQCENSSDKTVESSCLESVSQCESSGDKTIQSSCLESVSQCESSGEKLKADTVLADQADSLKDPHDFGIQSEGNVSDSSWPYLQQFCDETIFNQGSTDYLQKIGDEVCFPKLKTSIVTELTFGKKDIVLGGSMTDEAVNSGALSTSETLHETEDPEGCTDEYIGEPHRDNMEEEEMLLGLEIPKGSSYSNDDQETTRSSFPFGINSEVKPNNVLLDDESIAVNKIKTENSEQAVSTSAEKENTVLFSVLEHASCDPKAGDSGKIADHNNKCDPQSLTHRTVPVRNTEISPSWDRLLGHTPLDVRPSLGKVNSNTEEPTNHSVSFIASSSFKCKFKLPKGILSKAIKMSRDMKNVFEEPASITSQEISTNSSVDKVLKNNENPQEEPASTTSQEISTNSSVDKVLENNVNLQNGHGKLTSTETISICATAQICNSETTPRTSVPEFKFSPETLTAIQKAKTEFLAKRKGGRKLKQERIGKYLSKTVSPEACDQSLKDADTELEKCDVDQSLVVKPEDSHGSYQKLWQSSIRSGHEQGSLLSLFPEGVTCDFNLKEEDKLVNQLPSDITLSIEGSGDPTIETKDVNCNESVFHVSKSTTDNGLHGECLKQTRTDGIFSNIDFFQGFTDESANKQPREQPANKAPEVDKIMKTGIIDIDKLRLKLNPLISSRLKKRAAQTSVETQPHQDNKSVITTVELPPSSFENVQSGHKSPENFDLGVKCDLPSVVNVTQSDNNQRTHISEPQDLNSFTEDSDHICSPMYKQIPKVNAAKLCNILKNFHKNAIISSKTLTNPEGTLAGVTENNSTDKTLNVVINSSLLQESSQESSASTSKIEMTSKGRKRRRKAKIGSVAQTNVVKIVREMRSAKQKAKQKIQTTGCPKSLLQGKLSTGHEENVCDIDILKNEDKGERSFFDCLSSMPLVVWQDEKSDTYSSSGTINN